MALFLKQNESRSELQQRVAAELQEKLKLTPELTNEKPDPAILDNQHETRIAGKAILFLIALLVVAIIILALRAGGLI
ncbi:hypothetical protein EYC58_05550 [Candidatus Saccharibacteria bacterium]|nr:MAG: hypothetical protein EYC58_05550 [Candidatus Saccharibacteria bacterium]